MEELRSKFEVLLANVYVLYYRMHSTHWNVVGSNFPQYHSFLGELYDEVFDSIDDIAEELRKLDGFPPMDFMELLKSSTIPTGSAIVHSDVMDMMADIEDANSKISDELRSMIKLADANDEPSTGNFLQDRLSAHLKIAWKLKSTLVYAS
jgi:starvation-inducible DNA-binding protein